MLPLKPTAHSPEAVVGPLVSPHSYAVLLYPLSLSLCALTVPQALLAGQGKKPSSSTSHSVPSHPPQPQVFDLPAGYEDQPKLAMRDDSVRPLSEKEPIPMDSRSKSLHRGGFTTEVVVKTLLTIVTLYTHNILLSMG